VLFVGVDNWGYPIPVYISVLGALNARAPSLWWDLGIRCVVGFECSFLVATPKFDLNEVGRSFSFGAPLLGFFFMAG